jgi:hypothetical protein
MSGPQTQFLGKYLFVAHFYFGSTNPAILRCEALALGRCILRFHSRIDDYQPLAADFFGFLISGARSGPMLAQSGFDSTGCHSLAALVGR